MVIRNLNIPLFCFCCAIIPLFGLGLPINAGNSVHGIPDTVPARFFNNRYLHYNPEQYLEHHYDFALFQIETVGDFSLPDPYVFSFTGYSYLWNSYYYNGHCMDDLFFPGSPLHKVQLFNHGLVLNPAKATVEWITSDSENYRTGVQFNHGGLGGKAPFVDDLVHLFHSTASERMLVPITQRRKIRNQGTAFAVYPLKGRSGNYDQHFFLTTGTRMLPGFSYDGPSDFYPEDYLLFHHGGALPKLSKNLFDQNGYLFSLLRRDHLFSEYYFGRSETAKLNSGAFSFFGNKKTLNYRYSAGINFSVKKAERNEPGFERNLLDYDGEGLEPWYPGQNFFEWSLHFDVSRKLARHLELQLEMFEGLGLFRPAEPGFENYLYYQSSSSDRVNLYILDWESNPFSAGLLRNNLMLRYQQHPESRKFNVDIQAGLSLHGLLAGGSPIVRSGFESHINLGYRFTGFFSAALSAGRKPVPFNFDQIRFLSDDYLSGNILFWNENRDFYTTTGGSSHSLSESIRQPWIFYLDLPLLFEMGRKNHIRLTGQYRMFNDLWTVNYDQDAALYGHFTDIDGENIFFPEPGEVKYVVDNHDKGWMQSSTGNAGFLFRQPFYAGSTLSFNRETEKLFFSASVTAYMVVGSGAMGNGVLHNNVGMLSETMASPNNQINSVGRLDSDRSYLGKLFVSWAVHPEFTLAFQFSYRDGQPISDFGLSFSEADEGFLTAIWRKNLPGDNPFTGVTGAREDGFFNSVLRSRYMASVSDNYRIAFNLSVYNIYDFGTALSEFVFPPIRESGRYVLEICIPRGLIFSCELMF
jgi:hypothetical protein